MNNYLNKKDTRRRTPNMFLNGSDGYPLRHWELYEKLGLDPKKHLPDEGAPKQEIGNVTVWVVPRVPNTNQDAKRTWAECPACGCSFTAGKLALHLKGCKQLDNYSL
jgi:hypothetical protein